MRLPFRKPRPRGGPGPSYADVTSMELAFEAESSGRLVRLQLVPAELMRSKPRDPNESSNVVFVPPWVPDVREDLNQDVLYPLVVDGGRSSYGGYPTYDADSVVPSLLRFQVWEPPDRDATTVEVSLAIWGSGLAT